MIEVQTVQVPQHIKDGIRRGLKYGKRAMTIDEYCGKPPGYFKRWLKKVKGLLP